MVCRLHLRLEACDVCAAALLPTTQRRLAAIILRDLHVLGGWSNLKGGQDGRATAANLCTHRPLWHSERHSAMKSDTLVMDGQPRKSSL